MQTRHYRTNVRGNSIRIDEARNPIQVGDTFGGRSSKHSYDANLQLRNHSPMSPPDFTNPPEVTHYAPVAEVFDPDTPEGSLRELKRVEAAAWQGFHEEMRNKKRSAVACQGFLGQVIRVQEAQAKIRAEMRAKGGGRMPVEWERVKERIIKALESHPAALAAVLEALDEA